MAKRSNISVKVPQFKGRFDEYLNEELSRISAPIRWGLQDEARSNHRYTKRNESQPRPHLEESTIASGSLGRKERGIRKITLEARAKHAKWVIGGHGSWLPDPFIQNAINNKRSWVYGMVDIALNRVANRMNRG